MLFDSINLISGSEITNARVESGATFPTTPLLGHLFYLNAINAGRDPGFYVYDGTNWQTGDISGVIAGTGLSGGGTAGNVTLTVDTAVIATVAALSSHATDATLHLTTAQNTLLDGLASTLTFTELNYVDGVTSAIQTQLNSKLALAGGTLTGDVTLASSVSILDSTATTGYTDAHSLVNKQYVDAAAGQVAHDAGASYVPLAGGTLDTNAVIVALTPSTGFTANDLVNKSYVDTADTTLQSNINTKLNLSGGNLTGSLGMALNTVITAPTPIAGYQSGDDLVNFGYTEAAYAPISGSVANHFNALSIGVSGDIIPDVTQLRNIGSANKRFKAIYVDEAHLSVNTLYLGDTPILGTNSQTVNIHADPGQSIDIQTSGSGTTTISSAVGITAATNGANADVFFHALGASSNVRVSATNEFQVSATNATFYCPVTATSQHITGDLTIGGNLVVNGGTTTISSTTVTTHDNIIVVNSGEVGAGVTAGTAGIQVDRGTLSDYQIVFDETDDMFKVGLINELQTIASHDWVASLYSPLTHNHTVDSLTNVTIANKQTNDLLKWNGTAWINSVVDKTFIGLSNVDNTSDVNKPVSTATITAIGVANTRALTAEALLAPIANPVFTGTITGNGSTITNLNWSNIATNKPTTLSGYGITDGVNTSTLGANSGVATLDGAGKIPLSQLPNGGSSSNVLNGGVNQIVYQTAASTTGFLATANSGVLVTSATGVPSISTALPTGFVIDGGAF